VYQTCAIVFAVYRRRRKSDGQSTRPGYPGPADKADSVEGTPPPEYCPRPANKSGYADLGLSVVGRNPVKANDGLDTSMNRSLNRSPRRANQPVDGAPLGYVNRTFTDDGGVSEEPTRGHPRSPDDDVAGDVAGATLDNVIPLHNQSRRKNRRRNRSTDDSTSPTLPVQEVTGVLQPPPEDSERPENATRPDDVGFPSGLPHDGGSGFPLGSGPGDRSFEIGNPGFDVEDLASGRPFDRRDEGRVEPRSRLSGFPRKDGSGPPPAFDRLFSHSKPVPTPRGVGSYENLSAAPARGDGRLNRSFDPSSYLPDRSLASSAAGTHKGSAPDVRQRGGNTTIHFNTAAQAIDV